MTRIIEAENCLSDLLPAERLKSHPPQTLMAAAHTWSELVWATAQDSGSFVLSSQQVQQGLQLAQNPVFICGAHRSGTTLLRDILDGHSDLVVLPSEGTFYTNMEARLRSMPEKEWMAYIGKEWLRRLANPINQPPYWLLGRTAVDASHYIDFARYLMAWWEIVVRYDGGQWPHTAIVLAYASCINHLSARQWVDKTPTNERFLDRIWQEMPAAKIIHVIREPVATIASHKKMDPSWNFRHALRNLKDSFAVAGATSLLANPGFLLLRYEEICKEPKKTTAKMAAFLGIDLPESMNQPTVAGIPSSANSSFDKQAPGLIHAPRKHQHNKILSKSEKQFISAYLGKLSASQNYPLIKISFFTKFYLFLKYRTAGKS